MSEEDLELLITLDDPADPEKEDTFNHRRADSQITRLTIMSGCSHLAEIKNVGPGTPSGCEECLQTGDQWVHLRLCETCGHVGCCNNSKNRHAARHFHSTNHPLIRSFEPGEDWRWCYVDELFFEPSVEVTN